MKTIGYSLVLMALAVGSVVQGCAKAATTGGSSDGEFGGEGGGNTTDGSGGSPSGAGGASTTSAGGASTTSATTGVTTGGTTSSATTGSSTTSSSTTSGSTSSASSSASTGSSMGCPVGQHQCGGVCTGNTPQTGCSGSLDCLACSPPANGTSSCTAAGACDFSCGASYTKQGNSCVCSYACCTDADCGAGSTCMGGSCSTTTGSGPGTCNSDDCTASCIFGCIIQGKIGVGNCTNGACACVCL